MKHLTILLALSFFYNAGFSQQQFGVIQIIRPDQGEENVQTTVKGSIIFGLPFLYANWLLGQIVLANGQTYNNYKLKYDIFEQKLLFLQESVAMDVTDPVKEFTIYPPSGGNPKVFLNGNLYGKTNDNIYYELMISGEKGQLLKAHRKVIVSSSQMARIEKFEAQQTYYFYNSSSKKLIRLKNKSKLSELLKMSSTEEAALGLESYDLSTEENLINLFKEHFAYTGT